MNQKQRAIQRTVTKQDWELYFQANREVRLPIAWEKGVRVESGFRARLVVSLQRFQVGESGEGKHIKSCASRTGDAGYRRAIDLFIAEENYHAQMLAEVLKALDAPLLKGHWTDFAFILIRRVAGLELELMILLVAELIAKRYYSAVHDATEDENIRLMCIQILRDENAHVAFHCDTLHRSFSHFSKVRRVLIRSCWKRFYHFVCYIIGWDHRAILRAADVSMGQWISETGAVFNEAAEQIFAPASATEYTHSEHTQRLSFQKSTVP